MLSAIILGCFLGSDAAVCRDADLAWGLQISMLGQLAQDHLFKEEQLSTAHSGDLAPVAPRQYAHLHICNGGFSQTLLWQRFSSCYGSKTLFFGANVMECSATVCWSDTLLDVFVVGHRHNCDCTGNLYCCCCTMFVLHDVNNAALHVIATWWCVCMLYMDFAVCLMKQHSLLLRCTVVTFSCKCKNMQPTCNVFMQITMSCIDASSTTCSVQAVVTVYNLNVPTALLLMPVTFDAPAARLVLTEHLRVFAISQQRGVSLLTC